MNGWETCLLGVNLFGDVFQLFFAGWFGVWTKRNSHIF